EQANIEKAAKQKELELAQAELRSTKEKGDDLASKLELAQESLADEVGPKKQALTQEVDRLKQQIEENRLEQERQRALLVSAKEEVERAALVEKEKLEKQLASLKSDVESRDASLRGLEEQILQKQSALEEEQVSNKRALQQNAEELERVRQELVQATKGSEKAVELQQEVDRLSREKQELVQQGKEAALKNEKALEELRQSKDLEREELGKAKDRELAVLKSQVEQANIEKAAKQKELELAQAELRSTKEKGDDLASKLELAQESLLQGKGDKEKLDKEVARLKDEMRRNQEEQQRQRVELEKAKKELAALEKENERVQQHVERAQHELDQIARPMKKAAREERRGQEREHSQERGRTQERVIPTAVVKVSDRVATISDDQILQEFRALKDSQREVIVGSGKIQGIPQGNEAFHKYASENGALIGSKLDPETAKLMNDMEREKYKEIHAKYPYKDIDWQGGKKASISKDGVELCKLSDSVPVAKEYSLNGKVINNFRSLDVPLKADGGPMHMSLAVKDLQGKNISAKEAVYLSAHYDDQGKLVEMTTPVPVYFTSQDKESPVCIKQDGRVYTLPINRGRYEEMQKQIAINKGLVVDRTTELSHDQVEVSTRPVNKARQVIEGNPEALDKLKRHSSAHHSYPPVHRNQSKGNSRLME
ncbi:MAG: hypothetical protein J0L79_00590, partial [Rickettsiales bacterium]|nr:hypothetical protein [Rickettsiales bacterium]